MTLEDY